MNKLIRDNYKDIIDKEKLLFLSDKEVLPYAIKKIDEELNELKKSDFEDIYEYVDLIDTVLNVLTLKGFSIEEFEIARTIKNKEKGGFIDNIILKE